MKTFFLFTIVTAYAIAAFVGGQDTTARPNVPGNTPTMVQGSTTTKAPSVESSTTTKAPSVPESTTTRAPSVQESTTTRAPSVQESTTTKGSAAGQASPTTKSSIIGQVLSTTRGPAPSNVVESDAIRDVRAKCLQAVAGTPAYALLKKVLDEGRMTDDMARYLVKMFATDRDTVKKYLDSLEPPKIIASVPPPTPKTAKPVIAAPPPRG